MAARQHLRRGFSLLELVIVGAIITILSAIAIPRYGNSISNYRVSLVARRMAADIALAQARARALSTTQTVAFSVEKNKYQLPELPDPDHPGSLYTVTLSDPTLSATLVSAAFGSGTTLAINGFGIPVAPGTIKIKSGAATKTLSVNAETGAVTIQ